MIGSEVEFMNPYNSPNEKLDATYSVEKAPPEYAGEQSSGRGYSYLEQRHDLDEQEMADMEELRRRQGSRTSRSNRPKAARPRRRSLVNSEEAVGSMENIDQVMVDREEASGSDDSESEKAVVVKKRKSGTKSRLSSRKKSETQAMQEDNIELIKRSKGNLRELKGSLRGPKTSTPKNSPDGGLIPKKESRMNLGFERSPLKAPVVDRRQNHKSKVLDPPTNVPAGTRRLSMKDQSPRQLSLKDQEIDSGQSPEKEGLTRMTNRMPKSVERKSGHSKGKASDQRKGSLASEVDEPPRKSGKSICSHKKLKDVYEDESEREKFEHYNYKETPQKSTRRKSMPRQIITDDETRNNRIQKYKTGSEDDHLSYETRYEGVKVERKKSKSKTKMARRQVNMLIVKNCSLAFPFC